MYSLRSGGRKHCLAHQHRGLRCALVAMIFGLCATQAPGQCVEDQKLTASDQSPRSFFAFSVSLSGDTAIVGGPHEAVTIYRFNGTSWVEEQKLTPSDAVVGNGFGVWVSLSGDVAVVGAWFDDCAAGRQCGSAYVFRFDGTTWIEEQKLTASDADWGDRFGITVAVSGDTAVIGKLRDHCTSGENCGSQYVYRFDGSSWVEEQKLLPAGARDLSAGHVAVSGDTVMVGSPNESTGGNHRGAVYVFRFNGTSWVEQQRLITPDDVVFEDFGFSLSVSGNWAVVGAWKNGSASCYDCGSAYIYRFDGASWVLQQTLNASDAAWFDRFGASVSVSEGTVVVGAPWDDCPVGDQCGSAYVYRFNGSSWAEEQKLTASDAGDDHFARSVSVSGDTTFIGAWHADCPAGERCGSAYMFSCVPAPTGVCCFGIGGCDILTAIECDALDGRFLGANMPDPSCAETGDGDGVADLCDNCPDTDNADQKDCNDDGEGDACEADQAEQDDDFDGVCNGTDGCPDDPTKTDPGQCGCGNSDDHTDHDGIADCNDNCPDTDNADQEDCNDDGEGDACEADQAEQDNDFDGVCNGTDGCPDDPTKIDPGQCGCGNSDDHTDQDGIADCNDNCPDTDNANQEDCNDDGEGDACEADQAEQDDDFDGACNGVDGCPNDPSKSVPGDAPLQAPGQCGCGCPDPDPDLDGDGGCGGCCARPNNCRNNCPNDPAKFEPGVCGCGVPDVGDEDGDGFLDCVDQCRGVDDAIFAPQCSVAIPLVSEWGLVIMALLLLVAGKVYFASQAQPKM